MSQFKVGDIVMRCDGGSSYAPVGSVWKVMRVRPGLLVLRGITRKNVKLTSCSYVYRKLTKLEKAL